MRKFAGATTPCQSKAAVMRLTRSPPAAKEGRDDQEEHQRAQRHRIAQRQLRRRPAGLELARRQQRALDMRAPERLRDRIVLVGGDLVGDRGGRPMRLAAAAIEPAQAVGGARQPQHQPAAPPRPRVTRTKNNRPMARASGGSTSHRPAQENARNRPSAVASVASAGHSRSHNRLPRARLSARASSSPGRIRPVVNWLLVQSVQKPLRRQG